MTRTDTSTTGTAAIQLPFMCQDRRQFSCHDSLQLLTRAQHQEVGLQSASDPSRNVV